MALRKKIFRSGLAVTASSLIMQFFRIVTVIVLARLLDPVDFGLVGLAAVLVGAAEQFSGMGMGAALVASKADRDAAAFHGFAMTMASGLFFTLALIGLADVFAGFFDRPVLGSMYRWMSVVILVNTLAIIPRNVMVKEMMFGRQILPNTSGSIAYMVVAVALAVTTDMGAWCMVIAQIAQSVVRSLMTLLVCPTLAWLRPRKWDGVLAKAMARFGVTTMGTRLVQYAYDHGDDIVVGKVLGAAPLGFYQQSFNLSEIPDKHISLAAGGVLLPAYTRMSNEPKRLGKAFLESFRMVSVLTVPLAIGLLIVAPEAVILLIGEKWRNSIIILQVFSFMTLIRPISGTAGPLFMAIGKPGYNFRGAIIQGVTMACLIGPLIWLWQTPGVALAVVLAFVGGFAYNIHQVCRGTDLGISARKMLLQLWPVAVGAAALAMAVTALKPLLLTITGGSHNFATLAAMIVAGCATYLLTLWVLRRSLILDIFELVRSSMPGRRRRREASTPDEAAGATVEKSVKP